MTETVEKITVTLGKIAVIRGNCYGPGKISVPADIAARLVKFHDAQPERNAKMPEVPASLQTVTQAAAEVVDKGKAPMTAVAMILLQPEDEIRRQLEDKILALVEGMEPSIAAQQLAMAREMSIVDVARKLAKLAGYSGDNLLTTEELTAARTEPKEAEPKAKTTGQLRAGFPARAKLIALGITTPTKLRASKREDWKGLDQNEQDNVAAEVALMQE